MATKPTKKGTMKVTRTPKVAPVQTPDEGPQPTERPDYAQELRKLLQDLTRTAISVRKAKAAGWLDISGSGDGGLFLVEEKTALEPLLGRLGMRLSDTFATVPPYKVKALLEILRAELGGQG